MKRYVIQGRLFDWSPWKLYPSQQYDTLAEAEAAYERLNIKHGYRIAEAYTVVRYKAVKGLAGRTRNEEKA